MNDGQQMDNQQQEQVVLANFSVPSIEQMHALEEFYIDIINRVLYGTPTAFLEKYPTIDHYEEVIQAQILVESLCYEIVKKNASDKQQLQSIFVEGQTTIPQQISKPLYKAVKYRIADIFKQTITKQMRLGSAYLLAYDWKILVLSRSNIECIQQQPKHKKEQIADQTNANHIKRWLVKHCAPRNDFIGIKQFSQWIERDKKTIKKLMKNLNHISLHQFHKVIFKNRKYIMSFRHQVQIAIRFGQIRNVKIRQSVFLQLRITVFQKSKLSQTVSKVAIPFSIITEDTKKAQQPGMQLSPASKNRKAGSNQLNKNNSDIDENGTSFLSRKMLIRYAQQKIPINQVCIFRTEITSLSNQDIDKHQFFVYCQLLSFYQSQPEIIQQWMGHTYCTLVHEPVPIFFMAHRFTCSLQASIHSVIVSTEFVEDTVNKTLQQFITNKLIGTIKNSMTNSMAGSAMYGKFASKNLDVYSLITYPLEISYQKTLQQLKQFYKKIQPIQENKHQMKKIRQKIDNSVGKYGSIYIRFNKDLQGKRLKDKIEFAEKYIQKAEKEQLIKIVTQDLYFLRSQITNLWHAFIMNRVSIEGTTYFVDLKQIGKQNLEQQYIQKYILLGSQEKHIEPKRQEEILKAQHKLKFNPFVQSKCYMKMDQNVFQALTKPPYRKKAKNRLVIFVHGYQASSFDMEVLSNYFRYRDPTINVLLASSNEGRTEQPMQQSAHRLALQIKQYINQRESKDLEINFVCHSMGGIIARAALKYLQLYKQKMNLFIALCSPHLSFIYHTSTLVKTSLWVLNQFKKDPSMLQLTMQDNAKIQQTFLYELSLREQLKWFRNVVVLGSKQDEYVPFWSAMLHDKDFFFETESSRTYKTLLNNILEHTNNNLLRIQLVYNDKIKDISTLIGRTAHIKALNHVVTIDMLSFLLQKLL